MTGPIARIEAALSQFGREHEPPAGWEVRVLAATAAPRRRLWWLLATSAIAGLGAVVLCARHTPRHAISALAVDAPWDRTGPVVRGETPNVGDIVHATARGGAGYRAVWVYRRDTLVAACPGDAGCHVDGDATIADVELRSIDRYRIVGLSSAVPVPPPRGTFETDVATAQQAGAIYQLKELVLR
jgi:hypothetical protein